MTYLMMWHIIWRMFWYFEAWPCTSLLCHESRDRIFFGLFSLAPFAISLCLRSSFFAHHTQLERVHYYRRHKKSGCNTATFARREHNYYYCVHNRTMGQQNTRTSRQRRSVKPNQADAAAALRRPVNSSSCCCSSSIKRLKALFGSTDDDVRANAVWKKIKFVRAYIYICDAGCVCVVHGNTPQT